MSRLSYEQIEGIDRLIGDLDWTWGNVTAKAHKDESVEFTDVQQWALLDKLNRLVVAMTKAMPGAESKAKANEQSSLSSNASAIDALIPRLGARLASIKLHWKADIHPAWGLSWEFIDHIQDILGSPWRARFEQGGADGDYPVDVLRALKEKLTQETEEPK